MYVCFAYGFLFCAKCAINGMEEGQVGVPRVGCYLPSGILRRSNKGVKRWPLVPVRGGGRLNVSEVGADGAREDI